jgi:DtxR family Mn-dependent transcriptional regulator
MFHSPKRFHFIKDLKANSAMDKPLTSVMEDYLEAIFELDKEKKVVRVKDIAKRLGVRMPSVTNMLKTLNERDLIDYEKYEYLELTEKGANVGREIHRRHRVLRCFLMDILNIVPGTADEEACKMEHAISTSTLDRFLDFMEFIQSCPRAGTNFLERFEDFRLHGKGSARCIEHMKGFSEGFKKEMEAMEKIGDKSDGPQLR